MSTGITQAAKTDTGTRLFQLKDTPFPFECGTELSGINIAFEAYGTLNARRDNVILICHALTGDAQAAPPDIPRYDFDGIEEISIAPTGEFGTPHNGWWADLIGPGKALDTNRYCIVCSNILGSCYGSSGPASVNPLTGERFGMAFPEVSVRDMVRLQYRLLQGLGIRRLRSVIGGSLGGMQVLEWAILHAEFIDSIIPIATVARHSAWGIALNTAARQAITNDPVWQKGRYREQPAKGLALARSIAMLSYRSASSFNTRFGREQSPNPPHSPIAFRNQPAADFQVESYLRYQGKKLVERFDANTYLYLTRAMDTHDISRERDNLESVLASIKTPTLTIGVTSDLLYPIDEQRLLARYIPKVEFKTVYSDDGHDAFLIEFEQMGRFVKEFLG